MSTPLTTPFPRAAASSAGSNSAYRPGPGAGAVTSVHADDTVDRADSYFVCAIPRTGSSLLLGSTGVAGRPQSYFSPARRAVGVSDGPASSWGADDALAQATSWLRAEQTGTWCIGGAGEISGVGSTGRESKFDADEVDLLIRRSGEHNGVVRLGASDTVSCGYEDLARGNGVVSGVLTTPLRYGPRAHRPVRATVTARPSCRTTHRPRPGSPHPRSPHPTPRTPRSACPCHTPPSGHP
ncbi:Stf0 family sulfotransferase [Micromonospora sp. MW-13]|uniref:Stf0 family sulfotransferase n=1 Tax=Micromonospora sp. MW-13 TaxID=2094022 RepID=UPI000E43D521